MSRHCLWTSRAIRCLFPSNKCSVFNYPPPPSSFSCPLPQMLQASAGLHRQQRFNDVCTKLNTQQQSSVQNFWTFVIHFSHVSIPMECPLKSFQPYVCMHETTHEWIKLFWLNLILHNFARELLSHTSFHLDPVVFMTTLHEGLPTSVYTSTVAC